MTDASRDTTTDAVVILSVSTVLGKEKSSPIGSIMGGTTLYMKVKISLNSIGIRFGLDCK